jgi:FAD/FMN-containing dehydrogenase
MASSLIARLTDLLGPEGLDTRPDQLAIFAQDALGRRGGIPADPATPLAIARPISAEETAQVLALAAEAGVAVVAYGSGTGLMGGARSLRPGIVLDTVRMNRIDVRPDDRIVWAGAGAVLKDVDDELRRHGLCLGHDPWTFPVATVGGTLSTNGLGYKGGRYGGMGDQAIALEVALADGSVLRTRGVRRHSTGPDLARLFIGAEGTLGVITAAALKAHPVPEAEDLRGFNFATFEDGFAAIQAMAALGLRPSLLEYSEEHALTWPGLERDEEPPLLYLGFEGFTEEVEASVSRALAVVGENDGVELPGAQVLEFWEDRHVVAERFARGKPRRPGGWGGDGIVRDYMHVALPPSQVPAFRARCHAETEGGPVVLRECALWTAPDFFSALLALPEAEGSQERLTRTMDTLLEACQDLGGSMEYVHGAGLRLAHLMPREHAAGGFELLRRIKATLDPEGIVNPGKLGL